MAHVDSVKMGQEAAPALACDADRWRDAKRRPYLTVALFSGVIGACIFILIYGVQVLDGTYVDWIRNAAGDFAQSYYGWSFYRASAWHFPPGLMDSVAYPSLTSIIYIDSVPLFNFIFKVMSPLLPETFQFFGIWGLVCFVLNAALGSCCVYRLTRSTLYSVACSPFFALCTFAMQRLYTHTALAANWVILAGILLVLMTFDKSDRRRYMLLWAALFAVGVSVNIYYLPILGIIMVFFCIYRCVTLRSGMPVLSVFAPSLLGVVVAFWFFGGLYHLSSNSGATASSIGSLSANLNTLFNPMDTGLYLTGFKGLLPSRGLARFGQYEGYAYLGAGLIAALVFVIVGAIGRFGDMRRWLAQRRLAACLVLLCVLSLAIASWGTLVSVGSHSLFDIPYPAPILSLFRVFRSMGRFAWGVWDIVAIFVLVGLFRLVAKRGAMLLLLVILVLQLVDMDGMIANRQSLYVQRQGEYVPLVNIDGVKDLLSGKSHLLIFEGAEYGGRVLDQIHYDLGEAVLEGGATINDFYYSRRDDTAIDGATAEAQAELEEGKPRADTLYCFLGFGEAAKYQDTLHLYYESGFVFGSSTPIDGEEELGHIELVSARQLELPDANHGSLSGYIESDAIDRAAGEGRGYGIEARGLAVNDAGKTDTMVSVRGNKDSGFGFMNIIQGDWGLTVGLVSQVEAGTTEISLGGTGSLAIYRIGDAYGQG